MNMTEPVRTRSWPVSGVPGRLPQVTVFRGIPYAASTAGPNRRRPPQPLTPWREPRVIADEFGPRVVNVAATGDPNGPGLRRWAPVDAGSQETLLAGDSREPLTVAARRSASSPASSTPNRRGSRCTYRA